MGIPEGAVSQYFWNIRQVHVCCFSFLWWRLVQSTLIFSFQQWKFHRLCTLIRRKNCELTWSMIRNWSRTAEYLCLLEYQPLQTSSTSLFLPLISPVLFMSPLFLLLQPASLYDGFDPTYSLIPLLFTCVARRRPFHREGTSQKNNKQLNSCNEESLKYTFCFFFRKTLPISVDII